MAGQAQPGRARPAPASSTGILAAVRRGIRAQVRQALGRRRWIRTVRDLVREVPPVGRRDPVLALRIAAAEIRGTEDRLPGLLDRAIARTRASPVLRRRAQLYGGTGEVSAAYALWRELADRRYADAPYRARMLEGRLAETEPTWLPTIPGEREVLEPVSRRRILHIAKSSVPERWSGFTIRTLQNLRAQRAAGLDPVVVTDVGWPREVGVTDVPALITFDGFEHHRLDKGPGYVPSEIPFDVRLRDTVEAMVPIVRAVRPAILHAHSGHRGGEHALVALALRERFGIPVVYEVRGLFEAIWSPDPALAERSELFARMLAQETRLLHAVDAVLAISQALADDFVARGIPPAKITILPNGIDAAALGSPARDRALRTRLGLDGRFVVGYLGNLDHWREGIDVLIDALTELRRRGRTDVAVLVVGDGARRERWEEHARQRGVADGVRFTGRVPHDQVSAYYTQMDLFANPRVDERASRFITPLKPYEAMALGIPVLVSDLPALREIVDPPNRGVTAPPGDAVALADTIAALADDPDWRARLAAAAREWVLRERSWAANGARYRTTYESILGPLD